MSNLATKTTAKAVANKAPAKVVANKAPAKVVANKAPAKATLFKGVGAAKAATKATLRLKHSTDKLPTKYGAYNLTSTIRIVYTEGCPFRAGYGGRSGAWAALTNCKTVADYWLTGHKSKYLTEWAARRLIAITDAK